MIDRQTLLRNLWHWFRNRLLEIVIVGTIMIIPMLLFFGYVSTITPKPQSSSEIFLTLLVSYALALYWMIVSLYAFSTLIIQTVSRFTDLRNDRRFMRRLYIAHTIPWIPLSIWFIYAEDNGPANGLVLLLLVVVSLVAGYIGVRLTQRIVGMVG